MALTRTMELWHVNNSDPKEADAVPDGGPSGHEPTPTSTAPNAPTTTRATQTPPTRAPDAGPPSPCEQHSPLSPWPAQRSRKSTAPSSTEHGNTLTSFANGKNKQRPNTNGTHTRLANGENSGCVRSMRVATRPTPNATTTTSTRTISAPTGTTFPYGPSPTTTPNSGTRTSLPDGAKARTCGKRPTPYGRS